MARRTRAQISEDNRRAVLDAARRVFEERGYHGASLDLIADAADFSKGAVYSRFESKDELFLAVLEDHIDRRAAATADHLDRLDGVADMRALARASVLASVESIAWQAALLEFRAHAWRDPVVNARYAALHRRTVASVAGFIAGVYERRGGTPPRPVDDIAVIALANATGVVAELMADPSLDVLALIDSIVDETIITS